MCQAWLDSVSKIIIKKLCVENILCTCVYKEMKCEIFNAQSVHSADYLIRGVVVVEGMK